jgi:hypothetical protein
MKLLGVLLLVLCGGISAIPVAEARVDADGDGVPDLLGEVVTIEAVATCEPTLFSSGTGVSFYVQDETAGINVYGFDLPAFPVSPGDELAITGTIAQYNGLAEIEPGSSSDYELLGSPGVPDPMQLARNQGVSEPLEGMLLRAGDPSTGMWATVASQPEPSGGGYNFAVWNGQTSLAVRVNGSTGISVAGINPGIMLFLTGLGGQYDSEPPYDSGYQILPRYQTDLDVYSPDIPSGFHLDVSASPFSPSTGEYTVIEYGGPSGYRFTLRVFDRAGRTVATLAQSRTGSEILEWGGRDDSDEYLPVGPYLMLLEGFDDDGNRYTTTETVVIAAPLGGR